MAFDRIILKIILDFFVLACVGVPLLVIHLIVEPYHRGYFADDQSLMLPFKTQTISEGLLAGLGFALNVVMILMVEIVRDKRGKGIGDKFISGSLIPGWIWESYASIGIFTFGAGCQQLTVNFAKYVIGRLRPHFFDVCNPIPTTTANLTGHEYIEDFICTRADAARLKDMRLSFPSAHSSFAMYCAVFFIFYIQVKGKWRGSKLLRHGVQFAVLIGAWYVGLSRVVDHMHHWSDVAAGFVVGALYGIVVFIFVLKPKKYSDLSNWEPAPPEMLPRYKWLKNGKPFPPNANVVQSENDGTLVFKKPNKNDEGKYQCLAESNYGVASSSVSLKLAYINVPKISLQKHKPVVVVLESRTEKE